jgi:hypothetical protein
MEAVEDSIIWSGVMSEQYVLHGYEHLTIL